MSVRPEEFDHRYTIAAETVAARRTGKARGASAPAAVLFIPPGPSAERWRDLCGSYCHDHRYTIVAIATTWAAAFAMLISGEASVAVVGRRDHLPPDRTPRLEVVTEPQPVMPTRSPMSRRTVRRPRAAG